MLIYWRALRLWKVRRDAMLRVWDCILDAKHRVSTYKSLFIYEPPVHQHWMNIRIMAAKGLKQFAIILGIAS